MFYRLVPLLRLRYLFTQVINLRYHISFISFVGITINEDIYLFTDNGNSYPGDHFLEFLYCT